MPRDVKGALHIPTPKKIFMLIGSDGKPCSSVSPGLFGGHRGGKLYGHMDCRAALRAIARGGYVKHRIFFADEVAAITADYRPCAVCMPKEYAAWKKNQPAKSSRSAQNEGRS